MGHLYHTLKVQGTGRKRTGGRVGMPFPGKTGHCTPELSAALSIPAQEWPHPHSVVEGGQAHEAIPLSED